MTSFDDQALRRAFGSFATGVCLVATYKDGGPIAITVNSFSSVLPGPILLVFILKSWDNIFPSILRIHQVQC